MKFFVSTALLSLSILFMRGFAHLQGQGDVFNHRVKRDPTFMSYIQTELNHQMAQWEVKGETETTHDYENRISGESKEQKEKEIREAIVQRYGIKQIDTSLMKLEWKPSSFLHMVMVQFLEEVPFSGFDAPLDSGYTFSVDSLVLGFSEERLSFFPAYLHFEAKRMTIDSTTGAAAMETKVGELEGLSYFANDFMRKGNYKAAMTMYERALNYLPSDYVKEQLEEAKGKQLQVEFDQLLTLAERFFSEKEYEKALQYSEKALAKIPDDQKALGIKDTSSYELEIRRRPQDYFMEALIQEDSVLISRLFSFGATPVEREGDSPLIFELIAKEKVSYLKWFLEEGMRVEVVNKKGQSPLMVAVEKKDKNLIKILQNHPSTDFSQKDQNGCNILNYCIRNEQDGLDLEKTFRLALVNGAEVNTTCNEVPLIVQAIEADNEKYVSLLLLEGIDVNMKNKDGKSLLYLALSSNRDKVANLLIEKGADIDFLYEPDGLSVLQLSISLKNTKMANLLLDRGADFRIKCKNGWTALHMAAAKNELVLVRRLLEMGADKKEKDDEGRKPKKIAKDLGYIEVVGEL